MGKKEIRKWWEEKKEDSFFVCLKLIRNEAEILYVKDVWDIRTTNKKFDCNFK